MLSITKKFRFESAHAILNYDGLCKNIHGHSYVLLVTVTGAKDPETQMVIDFKFLKKIVDELFLSKVDHALILNKNHPKALFFDAYEGKKYLMDGEPTAENLLEHIADLISNQFPAGAKLSKLKLFETESSYAEWEPEIV